MLRFMQAQNAPLYEPPTRTRGATRTKGATVRIRALQHMNIIHLRKVIADETAQMLRNKTTNFEQMERVRKLLKNYVTALRDLKFMLERPSQSDEVAKFIKNLLYINTEEDAAILVHSGVESSSSTGLKWGTQIRFKEFIGYGGKIDLQVKKEKEKLAFSLRLQMAIFGGLALIAPMLIMRLHPTLLTQLLTTSLFVLSFGTALAFLLKDSDEKYIVSASAAYTAVLVVFVGASGS